MDIRLWVLATPIDGELVELTLASQVRRLLRPKRPIAGMRFLPPRLRTRVMNRIVIAAQKHDVLQDTAIWGRKRYRPDPACSAVRMARSGSSGAIANSSIRTASRISGPQRAERNFRQ